MTHDPTPVLPRYPMNCPAVIKNEIYNLAQQTAHVLPSCNRNGSSHFLSSKALSKERECKITK